LQPFNSYGDHNAEVNNIKLVNGSMYAISKLNDQQFISRKNSGEGRMRAFAAN
jgi:hypothetical protein